MLIETEMENLQVKCQSEDRIISKEQPGVTSNDSQPKTKNIRTRNKKWRENKNEGNLMTSKSTNKENDRQS